MKRRWYQREYVQEIAFFIAMFFLTMVHEWVEIKTPVGLLKGLSYFLILYGQAQLHRFFIFPLFIGKRYETYTILTLITTLFGAIILYGLDFYWLCPEAYQEMTISITGSLIYHFVICIISIAIMMAFYLFRQYSMELQRRTEDQLLLSEMNMKVLHAQINPHFFFNMFNNLYGVSLAEPERVSDLILKLSNLMRYQLENASKTSARLSDEVEFIQNYIAMEKERIGKRCDISVRLPEGDYGLQHYQIPPLILITLVENAFKHSLTTKNRWFVSLDLTVTRNTLRLHIRNSVPDNPLKSESTGIGLQNVQKRLELLYKGQHNFSFKEDSYICETKLIMVLNRF